MLEEERNEKPKMTLILSVSLALQIINQSVLI